MSKVGNRFGGPDPRCDVEVMQAGGVSAKDAALEIQPL